jgi:hypothetical protein
MPRNEFGNKKQKKKGRAPAHLNKFAYKHNPCSRKTEKILEMPNIHVCQRCSDKIEWRKKYRKYKPRTQPGTCNECRRRNVTAAYHTICTKCTTESAKAKKLIKELTAKPEGPEGNAQEEPEECARVCAVCVKELALPDPEEEGDDRDFIDQMARLKLRERRALERKIAKEEREAEEEARRLKNGDGGNSEDGEDDDENGDDNSQNNLDPLQEGDDEDDSDYAPDYGDDEDDPFLKAIGGADKLLTGKAYQQKLLQQQQQSN